MIPSPHFQPRFSGLHRTFAFTLTELIVAAALTGTALLMSGVGLSTLTASSTAVTESTERKDELNRAMDFIAEELREAEAINQVNIDSIRNRADYRNQLSSVSVDPDSIQEVLWFEVDGEEIVYYVGEPTSNNGGPWTGPQAVYRWGPKFDADGVYDNTRREHTLLIDSLDNSITGDPANPICHSGWNPAFADPTNLGFFACVDSAGKVAELIKVGRVNRVLGQSETIQQKREVYSRALETQAAPRLRSRRTPNPPDCVTGDCGGINPEDFTITRNLSELVLENRGGAITCGAGGATVGTVTTVELTRPGNAPDVYDLRPQSSVVLQDIPQDSILRVESQAESCGRIRADSDKDIGTQVIMLHDGQRIPFYEPFDNQQNIQEFLTAEELPARDNVLSLPPNRRVILFELGVRDRNKPAYDFQDVVVVVDIRPEIRTQPTAQSTEPSAT